ncbi:MAG: SUMF1/EgtB/PvdO family nonheme iron enzyme, partial [Alphaproteobacteria bacterium]|nr:SUMF1/EgtB/PvdO family nonheme iron enzyme [Alphaproteobacteria bacterium]
NCMKIFLLFLTICFAFANAQFYYDKHGESRGAYKDSLEYSKLVELAKRFRGSILVKKPVEGVKPRKNLEKFHENKIQRTFYVSRDTLDKENWLEVEKNEIVKICVDEPVVAWETSLKAIISSDSCLAFQAPTLIGVETLRVHFYKEYMPYYINFYNDVYSYKINLAVGMKYLNFENEEVLLGFNKYNETELYALGYKNNHDPERLVTITGTYLIDKYPVTNCEIIQLMWDNLPSKRTSFTNWNRKRLADEWVTRKRNSSRHETCDVHDSAACTILLLQAIKYANARSIREGLKPYYTFSSSNKVDSRIISKGNYIIGYFDFTNKDEGKEEIQVSIDSTSDGYRLPFYDEWMIFARGGDKKKQAPWSDSATFEEASKYAQLGPEWHYDKSKPVGQLLPNGYGLYDMLGLVEEHVLFEEKNPFSAPRNKPSCVKGANDRTEQEWKPASKSSGPYWKDVNYGYYRGNDNEGLPAGFRLIRNIGNNAKWENRIE